MTKQVHIFGRKSLEEAQQHLQNHPGRNLIMLKNSRGRIAVCSPAKAQELKTQGFQLIDSEN